MSSPTTSKENRLRDLTDQYLEIAIRLRQGGGAAKVEKQQKSGKLAARERIEAMLDERSPWLEIGLLVA